MSFFDSPIARCEAIHEMVLCDETQMECAHEHDCPPDRDCPLAGYFTKNSGISEDTVEQLPRMSKRRTSWRYAAAA